MRTAGQPGVSLRSSGVSDRRTYLNLGAVHRWELFVAAGELVGPAEPRGPALVVAQAAVEVGVEKAIDFALQLRGVYDPLAVWVLEESIYSWSPHNKRVQRLWKALTSDVLSDAPSWANYATGLQRRHDFVHRAAAVSEQEAKQFLTAAEELMGHMTDVLTKTFPAPDADPTASD
jgi:hypothetical protein